MNLQHARQHLLAAQAELEARLQRTHKHIHGRTEEVSPNFHEQVIETGNDQVVQVLEQEGRERLHRIQRALQRIDAGTYAQCVKCGKAIGAERLQALPWVELCIHCA